MYRLTSLNKCSDSTIPSCNNVGMLASHQQMGREGGIRKDRRAPSRRTPPVEQGGAPSNRRTSVAFYSFGPDRPHPPQYPPVTQLLRAGLSTFRTARRVRQSGPLWGGALVALPPPAKAKLGAKLEENF